MNYVEKKIFDPYISVENNLTAKAQRKNLNRGDKLRRNLKIRRITQRKVALSIFYSIITLGIYGYFWLYELTKETITLTNKKSDWKPCLVVLLSFITFGIFTIVWAYKMGVRQNTFFNFFFRQKKSLHVKYLVIMIFNVLLPVLSLWCFASMQRNLNKMIDVCDTYYFPEGFYVKDSNIFNKPIFSVVVLFLILEIFPPILSIVVEIILGFLPSSITGVNMSMLSGADAGQELIQSSADQVKNANTPYVMVTTIISIISYLCVLWWFKLRWKYASYKGVLCLKNLGRACLLGLPGLLFVALNVLGMNASNLKFGIVLLGFVPGFTEEIMFRGMIIPNFMRIYHRSKGIWISLFVSAAIFGLAHAANVFVGADPGITVFQVCYAFALGVFLAGIVVRTGNLWVPILIHGLTDTFALASDLATQQGAVQTQAFEFSAEVFPIILISAFLIFWGIWICRPKKHNDIILLWCKKWGDALV